MLVEYRVYKSLAILFGHSIIHARALGVGAALLQSKNFV